MSAVSTTKLSVLSNDEKTLHVRAAARIDVCAAERRSVRQRYRLRLRHDDEEDDDDDDDDDDNIVVVVGDARLSFGCTGARLSIWEPTLPFLLLSSAAPHPSATAAAAAAASLRPNPRSADTSTPFLRIFRLLSFFHSLFMHSLSIYPSFLLSLSLLPPSFSDFEPFLSRSSSFFLPLLFSFFRFFFCSSSLRATPIAILKGRCSSFFPPPPSFSSPRCYIATQRFFPSLFPLSFPPSRLPYSSSSSSPSSSYVNNEGLRSRIINIFLSGVVERISGPWRVCFNGPSSSRTTTVLPYK